MDSSGPAGIASVEPDAPPSDDRGRAVPTVEVAVLALVPRPAVVAALVTALAASLLGFVVYLLCVLGDLRDVAPYGFLGLYAAALAAWGLYSHVQRAAYARRVPVTLRATRAGLGPIEREDIVEGYFQPRRHGGGAGTLRLLGRWNRVLFQAETTQETARQTLDALGLGVLEHRATFSASGPALATIPRQLGVVVGLLTTIHGLVPAAWHEPASLVVLGPMIVLLGWPARLGIGLDGFTASWFLWKDFVPMADMVSVEAHEDRAIVLTLRSGMQRTWYTAMRQKHAPPRHREHRDAVLLRMQEALEAARARPRAPRVAELVERAGRRHEAWLAALTELRTRETDYRTPALSREDLWRLVEDPAAPPDARAGAAFVLRGGSAEPERVRLRSAANATASPRLRIALDSAAEGDEQELADALDAVDPGVYADPVSHRARD